MNELAKTNSKLSVKAVSFVLTMRPNSCWCYCSANEWLFVFGLLLAVLFSPIWIHYSAYYSALIEYKYTIRYSPNIYRKHAVRVSCVLCRKKAFTHHCHLSRLWWSKTVSYKQPAAVEYATWSMEDCTMWDCRHCWLVWNKYQL